MICRLTGRVASIAEDAVVIDIGGLAYEVLIPAFAAAELQELVGSELTLFTIQYFEGNPAGVHLTPRLVGFLAEADRELFSLLTKVKGISIRKGLRVMSVPTPQIAAAVQSGDARLLTSLPEIGKKMAAQIIAELQDKMRPFVVPSAAPSPAAELTEAQRVAVEILVQWGDRRVDAQRWVAAAVGADPQLADPEAIIRAAYRAKQTAPP